MTTPAWLPSPSLLVWVIYTSLLLGNAMGLVNESKDAEDIRQDIRQDLHSTRAAWTESLKPSSALPTHAPTHVTSPLSITTGMLSNTPGCGNKSSSCSGYCDICGPADRQFCYEILHKLQCHTKFVETIEGFNDTALCKRDVVLKPYNNFSACSEEIADCLLIPWPNPMVEDVFVEIHTKYFQDCPLQELRDPPPGIVFALVMTPICLIPAMVFLVVLKTKNGDGMS
ncbi:receptor activity-modifying protein 2 isoform X1 [Engraulis encrasicolus]|uniref:receptor activity-modifying protein 2 isoform X1 n=1 Tax=Engraulis encrasicolus TaxID=184585 RepID=UPI002FD09631